MLRYRLYKKIVNANLGNVKYIGLLDHSPDPTTLVCRAVPLLVSQSHLFTSISPRVGAKRPVVLDCHSCPNVQFGQRSFRCKIAQQ